MTFWLRFGLIAFAAAALFLGGHKVARMQCKAEQAEALQKAVEARKVDESFTQGVSAAYEGVAAQLRRLAAVNKTEVIRETSRIEYRCELPAAGERLRIDGIRAANAASGQPDPAMPPDTGNSGKGSRGASDRIYGPGDDDGGVQR